MERIFTDKERENYKGLIEYSEEFIDKCLNVYLDDEEMVELLKEKSFLVITKIQREINKEITSSDIIEAYEYDNIDEIVQTAYKIEINKDLQNDFIKLYDKQYRSKGKYIKDGRVVSSLGKNYFRKPVSVEKLPIPEPSDRLKAALEYNENCQAAGRIAAGNHIAGGGIIPESSEPGGALEKKYSK